MACIIVELVRTYMTLHISHNNKYDNAKGNKDMQNLAPTKKTGCFPTDLFEASNEIRRLTILSGIKFVNRRILRLSK